MHSKNNYLIILLTSVLIIIASDPVYAVNEQDKFADISLITTFDQTISKDALSLVDKNRLDIGAGPDLLCFSWSPDGSRVLTMAKINVYTKGETPSGKTMGTINALYIANGDGSDIKRITWAENTQYTRQQGEHKWIESPTWSSMGEAFFYALKSGGNSQFIGGSHEIIVVDANNLDSIASKDLTDKEGPIYEWAPHGDSVLYLGPNEQYEPTVFLMASSTGVSEELPLSRYKKYFNNEDLIWSPDGRKIGFEENGKIFILDVETREVKTIFSTDGLKLPDKNALIIDKITFWSPDSSTITVSIVSEIIGKIEDNNLDIYVIDVKSGRSHKLLSLEGWSSTHMGWFHSSDRILYKSVSKTGTDSIDYSLHSVSIENGDENLLFTSPDDFHAVFSPSGQYIAVKAVVNGKPALVLMNNDGSNKIQWFLKETANIVWHENKDELMLEIVNENQSTSLVTINALTKEIGQIPFPDKNIEKFSWSPDGRNLIIVPAEDYFLENKAPASTIVPTSGPTAEVSGLPGFNLSITLAGLLSALLCLRLKSRD
ncbi:MAG: hypothetical protein M8350_09115 [Methanosarcinaceae archaeon]|nr:hypothetical protein [Methanosarcinaceae archaeon]